MVKALHLSLSYVKPSLFKGPFSRTSRKKATEELDDVPDIASASCSEGEDSKKPVKDIHDCRDEDISSSSHEASDLILSNTPQHELKTDMEDDYNDESSIPCIEKEDEEEKPNHSTLPSHCGNVPAAVNAQQPTVDVAAANREQQQHRQQSKACVPSNIVLLPSNLHDYARDHHHHHDDEDDSDHQESSEESNASDSIHGRLDQAEALILSYQDTIRSNEHLIDSLHKTLAKTREDAFNVMAGNRDLEKAVDLLLQERESLENEVIPEPKVFLKMAMGCSLLFYLCGITTEYPLIATVMVFLLEGIFL